VTELTNLQLEAVEVSTIPEGRNNSPRGHYFSILTDFWNSGETAARLNIDGDAKASTVVSYMRKVIAKNGFTITVLLRSGQVYLVRK
jgi:hypothetical protein